MALGYATMAGLKAALPPFALPRETNVTMDGRVLLFALAPVGVHRRPVRTVPAFQATRPDLAGTMKEGGRGASAGGARQRVRGALVVAEVALAFVLLTGAGLLIRSFFDHAASRSRLRCRPTRSPRDCRSRDKRFPDPDQLNGYLRRIEDNIGALPGVRDVALTSALPLAGLGIWHAVPDLPAAPWWTAPTATPASSRW